jgi:hypothetical protein
MTLRTYIALRKIAADAALNAADKNNYLEPPKNIPPPKGADPGTLKPPANAQSNNVGPAGAGPLRAPQLGAQTLKPGEAYFRTKSGGYAVADKNTNIAGWQQISPDEYNQGLATRRSQERADTKTGARMVPKATAVPKNARPTDFVRPQEIENNKYSNNFFNSPIARQQLVGSAPPAAVVSNPTTQLEMGAELANDRLNRGRSASEIRKADNELEYARKAARGELSGASAAGYTPAELQYYGEQRLRNIKSNADLLKTLRTDLTPAQKAQAQKRYDASRYDYYRHSINEDGTPNNAGTWYNTDSRINYEDPAQWNELLAEYSQPAPNKQLDAWKRWLQTNDPNKNWSLLW